MKHFPMVQYIKFTRLTLTGERFSWIKVTTLTEIMSHHFTYEVNQTFVIFQIFYFSTFKYVLIQQRYKTIY